MRRLLFLLSCGLLLAFAVIPFGISFAQTTGAVSNEITDRQTQLQNQLDAIEAQINQQQQLLSAAQSAHQTLQSQINAFDAQIKKTQLQIQAINLTIEQLNGGISTDNSTLSQLSDKLQGERDSLGQILRQTQILDDYSVVDVALSSKDVSSFFSDLDSFASIKASLFQSFQDIQQTSSSTASHEAALETKLTEQQQLQTEAQLAKQQVQSQENEKQKLLNATKGQEANYQQYIAAQQKTAAQIRSELFTLRDSAAIPFGQALTYAEQAEKATGVRPAVTLAILKQETNLGENLGTGIWTVDMNPRIDQPVFPYITSTLGLDPNKMPVSKRPSYGWGGAMGPGQFIPSTWVCYGGYINTVTGTCSPTKAVSGNAFWKGPWKYVASKDRVRKLTGENAPSNPWSAEDAIMATAMLLADNGAATQTYAAERLAALRYFAGWGGASNPAYAFYGDDVMSFATDFQQQIDILNGSN